MNSYAETDRGYERFQLIANGPALFNAVVTGLELDIFGFLSRNPGATLDDINGFVGIPPHKLRILMLALCSTELIEKHDGRYSNSGIAEELLASDGPDSWRHILIGWQRIYYPAFAHMTQALRTGTNTALSAYPGTEPTLYQRLAHSPELEAVLHASMGAFTSQSMDGLLNHSELLSVRHLLDIGGGDGTTAAAIAARYPDMTVTIFDMPSVTRLAEQTVSAGLTDRVGLHPGDLFDDPFPPGADAVLFSHVLEVFSAEQIRILLAKAFQALPEGGKLLLYGFNASDDESGGVLSSRLSLYLNILATGQGMAYPAANYETWLREAGCSKVESFTGLPYEHGLTVGVK